MLQFKNDSCCKILAKAFIVFWNSSVSLTQQLIITYFRLPKLASCTLFSYAPRFQEAKKKPKVSSIKADTDRVVRVRLTAGNNPCPDDQKNLSSSVARYTQVQHQRWMINVHSSVHWFIHHILTFIYSANPWGEVMTRRALLTVPNEMAWSFFFWWNCLVQVWQFETWAKCDWKLPKMLYTQWRENLQFLFDFNLTFFSTTESIAIPLSLLFITDQSLVFFLPRSYAPL